MQQKEEKRVTQADVACNICVYVYVCVCVCVCVCVSVCVSSAVRVVNLRVDRLGKTLETAWRVVLLFWASA